MQKWTIYLKLWFAAAAPVQIRDHGRKGWLTLLFFCQDTGFNSHVWYGEILLMEGYTLTLKKDRADHVE